MSSDQPENPFGLPNFDFTEMLRQFQMPGIDFGRLMENERKNIEAVQQANQALVEGWQALAEKQAEVFRETMELWQQRLGEGLSGEPQAAMEHQAELAREGFEKALDNMRQLAEIATESQTKAFEVIRKRIEENMRAFSNPTEASDDG
jgi:phasin family protein